jgi:chaperone modulatory protein CbpM
MDSFIMTMRSELHPTQVQLSFAELCWSADVSHDTLLALVQNEIAVPITGNQPAQWRFHLNTVPKVQKAARLYRDLEMDWAELSLVLNLLDEINRLQNENNDLKQKVERYIWSHYRN